VRADHVEAGPQPQVERVAEHDLRADLLQLARAHRLHGAVVPTGMKAGVSTCRRRSPSVAAARAPSVA
jgi:hypothetical protein